MWGVLRLDASAYEEIEADTGAIPQAFAVVIATSVLIGLGYGSLTGLFLGISVSLTLWLVGAALVWGVATLANDAVQFPRLMRCLGFADAWFALLIGSGLPWIGPLFGLAAVAGAFTSAVLATRAVTRNTTGHAIGICTAALGGPLLILLLVSACAQ
ncbi:MAG: hypothetical protein JRG82_17515 [Deltaproteobacteria bacterium]|nr:hypothetical protein [Deltaproteobacteria bacterium]